MIEKFQKETKTEFLIKDVDSNFRLRFETFCIKENYAPNTISQVIKSIHLIISQNENTYLLHYRF